MLRRDKRTALLLSASAAAALLLLPGLAPAGGQEEGVGRPDARSGDVISIGSPVEVTRDVEGSVIVLGSSAFIDANVAGDVVVLGGEVETGPRARIEGDLVTLGGEVRGAVEEAVGGALVTVAAPGRASMPMAVRDGVAEFLRFALKLALLVFWLAAAVVITLVSGREVRATSTELRASPFHVITLGLVAMTSFALTALVFSYLIPFVVGIPLLLLLGAFAVVLKIFGMVAVFHLVGSLILRERSRDELARPRLFRGDLAMVVAGLLVLGFVRLIPVVGNIVWMTASLFAVGVALATGFGRREPWFLSWRVVENR